MKDDVICTTDTFATKSHIQPYIFVPAKVPVETWEVPLTNTQISKQKKEKQNPLVHCSSLPINHDTSRSVFEKSMQCPCERLVFEHNAT